MNDLVLETKLYNLSTRGSSCNILNSNKDMKSLCEYDIPNMIVRDESVEYIQFSVPDAVIPVSFYTVNENNCRLNIRENTTSLSYVFPYGNYTATTFMAQFETLLGTRWDISLNSFNSVFTISNSTYTFVLFDTSTISSIMGFSSSASSGANLFLTLPRCCNFLSLPRISMRCAELANTNMISANSSSDLVITIPNNSRPNGQIYYQNQSHAKLLFRHHELSRFVISLTDDDGNLLNFNGVSSFFTFQFDIYRKYSPKPPRFGNLVEYVNSRTSNYYEEEEPFEMNV